MKTKNIVTTVILFIGSLMIFSCGNTTSSDSNSTKADTQQTDSIKYQCPMGCEGDKTYSSPGNCPVCEMEMEEIHSGEH